MAERILEAMMLVAVLIVLSVHQASSDETDHRYRVGDPVPLYANKVGPYRNPSETYGYFDLGYCMPDNVKRKKLSLVEVLNGDRLVSAPYQLEFLREKHSESVCKKKLSKEEVARFRAAVSEDYYFQMYFDDLPIWAFLGSFEKERIDSKHRYYLFKHIQFDIFYNEDRVIEINAMTHLNEVVDLPEDKEVDVEFLCTVKWKKTNTLLRRGWISTLS
ncbi:unnamed protein product [Dovyalis caffra]|uniref:Transmembrane 9 superfamily member n=1 Tax=Dovyalis caffra TaxID=77055 RepID=A0AAV1R200_9ROSI|nr:unnamed protein product [Dovyalis caffra]